jgi:hypothetical protein
MDEEITDDGSEQSSDEPASEAVLESAATGSIAGPAGLVGGAVLGWLISRVARRRRTSA